MEAINGTHGMSRYIRAEAASPYERGRLLGESISMQIRTLLEYQTQHYLQKDGEQLRDSWMPSVERFVPFIWKHAPNTWSEMEGMAKGAGVDFEEILILSTVYEKKVGFGSDHCTAFAATGTTTADGNLICGQTNDESMIEWAGGALDLVTHHIGEEQETLIYTHPGIPAYMGMNSYGLCFLWNYIDNGERGVGVPTNILIRETLCKKTLSEAVAYLEETPRCIPNNFLLAHKEEGICNVELFPDAALKTDRSEVVVHANHILDTGKSAHDVKLVRREIETTFLRQQALEELCDKERGSIDITKAKSFFRDHSRGWGSICVHPHVRPHTRARVNKTLAAMVFHPTEGEMHIAFGNACETSYMTFRFDRRPV